MPAPVRTRAPDRLAESDALREHALLKMRRIELGSEQNGPRLLLKGDVGCRAHHSGDGAVAASSASRLVVAGKRSRMIADLATSTKPVRGAAPVQSMLCAPLSTTAGRRPARVAPESRLRERSRAQAPWGTANLTVPRQVVEHRGQVHNRVLHHPNRTGCGGRPSAAACPRPGSAARAAVSTYPASSDLVSTPASRPDAYPNPAPMIIDTQTTKRALSRLSERRLSNDSLSGVCRRKAKVQA